MTLQHSVPRDKRGYLHNQTILCTNHINSSEPTYISVLGSGLDLKLALRCDCVESPLL